MTLLSSGLAVALAYLIGGIPFGYLVVRWVRGVDIRTLGSGNIGATNVGRNLGFRFFVLVFALDLLKGLLPTLFLSKGLAALGLPVTTDLPVFVGLAAILGHNFPIYLRLKGGKGVATSLGVLFALDPVASIASIAGFLVFLALTGYVSLSSILGGACFVAMHFMHTSEPFSRGEVAMSVVTLSLMGLVTLRHRANLARIAAGTEPKLKFKKEKRSGRISVALLLGLVGIGAVAGLGLNALRHSSLSVRSIQIEEVARLATRHQRAERMAFLDHGKLLAVTCPRYGRVILAQVSDSHELTTLQDIKLEGRPVGVGASADRLYVVQRPNGDARHLEEAWWDTFDFTGKPAGPRVRLGYDPDDIALHPDGKHALILSSGHAEGETNRPNPALLVFDLDSSSSTPVARLSFDEPRDDPARLALSDDGKLAAVTLGGSRQLAWIDLADVLAPKLDRRESLESLLTPDAVHFDHGGKLWVADPDGTSFVRQMQPGGPLVPAEKSGATADFATLPIDQGIVAASLPRGSGVGLFDVESGSDLGRLPVRGTMNLAATRPLGLAVSTERDLLAVSNRAGGSVHLFHLKKVMAPTSVDRP